MGTFVPRSPGTRRAGPDVRDVQHARLDTRTRSRSMQTRNADLQSKLDHLNALARQGNREAFVRAFVPLDLTEEDLQGFLEDLQTEPEQWTNLKAEIDAIASGTNVTKIQGDQVKKATYFFRHPLIELCDREVCAKREARPSAVLSRGPDDTPPRPFCARR